MEQLFNKFLPNWQFALHIFITFCIARQFNITIKYSIVFYLGVIPIFNITLNKITELSTRYKIAKKWFQLILAPTLCFLIFHMIVIGYNILFDFKLMDNIFSGSYKTAILSIILNRNILVFSLLLFIVSRLMQAHDYQIDLINEKYREGKNNQKIQIEPQPEIIKSSKSVV